MFRVSVGRVFGVIWAITMPNANPKIQAPNPNHSQIPKPKLLPTVRAVWDLGLGTWDLGLGTWDLGFGFGRWEFVGIWQLGVVGIWSLELGI